MENRLAYTANNFFSLRGMVKNKLKGYRVGPSSKAQRRPVRAAIEAQPEAQFTSSRYGRIILRYAFF